MYVRVVTWRIDADSCQRSGVFQPAYDLYYAGELDQDEQHALNTSLLWFEQNLPTPNRSKLHRRAIFWFKPDARAMARRVWDLAAVVKRHALGAEIVKTTRPGYICYEDEFQVAAIPFRDTFYYIR
jgi:hypothetical protein